MPWVGFELTVPASERAKTVHALDRSASVTGYALDRSAAVTGSITINIAKLVLTKLHNEELHNLYSSQI
jgi:hypothetical protein